MSRFIFTLLCLVFLWSSLAACNGRQYDPNYWHQNFVAFLQKNVGKHFESVRRGETGGWARDEYFLERTELPNGNVAYKYRYQGACRYIFEVDPKTDIVVAARWEGEAKNCIIIP